MDFAALPTAVLRQLLKDDCDGKGKLTTDDILTVCELLAERSPSTDPKSAWDRFCTCLSDSE